MMQSRMDRELADILREADTEVRLKRLLQLEERLKVNTAMVFLYHTRQRSLYHDALAGVSLNALGWVPYKNIWFQHPVINNGT